MKSGLQIESLEELILYNALEGGDTINNKVACNVHIMNQVDNFMQFFCTPSFGDFWNNSKPKF